MRVLLDKSVPYGVKRCISDHEIDTIAAKGWGALSNGKLLVVAETLFDVFVTCDQNIARQQNLTKIRIAIVVINTNVSPVIQINMAPITQAVDAATPGAYQVVKYPKPALRRKPYTARMP